MVPHLINAGHEVGVVDVGREAVERAVSHGAFEASGPAELTATCEIVLTSLPTGVEVEDVYMGEGGLMEAVGEGGLLVDLSTIEPEQSRKLAAEAAERGAVAIDAPVSGGVMGAEAASLTIMVGGPKEAFDDGAARSGVAGEKHHSRRGVRRGAGRETLQQFNRRRHHGGGGGGVRHGQGVGCGHKDSPRSDTHEQRRELGDGKRPALSRPHRGRAFE